MTAPGNQPGDTPTQPNPTLSGFFSWSPDEAPAPYPPPVPAAPVRTESPSKGSATIAAPPPVGRTARPEPRLKWIAAAVLSLAGVLVISIGAVALWRSIAPGNDDDEVTGDALSEIPPQAAVPDETERLLAIIPGSDTTRDCVPAQPPSSAAARVECTLRPAPVGVVTYTLYPTLDTLDAALTEQIEDMQVEVCPGNYQSPGPWRRTADPDVAAGTLVCGYRSATPILGWTTTTTLVLSVVRADAPSTLSDLYTWWSQNS